MAAKECIGAGQKVDKPRFFPAEVVKCPECNKTFIGLIPGDTVPTHIPKTKNS